MYLIVNSNLMYHASIPMTDEGEFKTVIVDGKPYAGRSLLDKLDRLTREAYFGGNGAKSQQMALDYMWYLWCGPESPFFDKAKMATLERYLIEDKKTHHEEKGAYYKHLDDTKMCSMILSAFGLDPEKSHIISGHVPVKTCKGESPIKAGGKLLMIDGGFSKAYHSETGIAGYTLIYNSHGLQLVQHEPFESAVKAVEEGQDIISTKVIVEATTDRITVRDTTYRQGVAGADRRPEEPAGGLSQRPDQGTEVTEGSVAAKYPCPGDSFCPVGVLRKTIFEGANRSFRFGSKAGDKSGPQLLRCGPLLRYRRN